MVQDPILPTYIDLAIVGAGPQGLTLATHLLQKRAKLRNRLMVFDPSGTWLHQWRHQFVAQDIPHLRSPAVHHPDPNPYALRSFAENRRQELFLPYDLPGTQLFNDFCLSVIKRWQLDHVVYPDAVIRLLPRKDGLRRRFQLILASGNSLIARRVILATGSSVPQVPDWAKKIVTPYPQDRLLHSHQVDLRTVSLTGERILIVGGGLTSGHLAIGAIARGAKVILMARRELQEKLFDADPGWLGPKYLKGFNSEPDWEKRWEMILSARNGGSMTPGMMLRLKNLAREGKLSLQERCEVMGATWQDNQWQLRCQDGQGVECDRLWLATGTQFRGEEHPLLVDILNSYPTLFVKGLPILDEYLRWPPLELFMMGELGALQVGPVARNLAGAIKASQRITEALLKPSLAIA